MADDAKTQSINVPDRYIGPARPEDEEDLGPLSLLPGTWSNKELRGRGWNMIALPFADGEFNFRLLMNQYDEELVFTEVAKDVPNRGIRRNGAIQAADQKVVTLDYQQTIRQLAAADDADSGLEGNPDSGIHHEPGLFLHMLNERTNGLDIARLGTIPHGDSVLALGKSKRTDGGPDIPETVSGLPIGVSDDLASRYLGPYKHFVDNPFKGELEGNAGFPGFSPVDTTNLLKLANQTVDIARTTTLDVDTAIETAGIVNLPFIVKQANAADMKSTFWIEELSEKDDDGKPKLRLQYLQVVLLDFFPRRDGLPGPIRWPHISINTMTKVA